jgi:hypothetical protein
MFCNVKQNVSIANTIIPNVRKNPQQLDDYGYAFSMGRAANTSQNLMNSDRLCNILDFKPENEEL